MTNTNNSKNQADKVRVAEYVRMSTDHQQYSTENQADVIHKYAEAHNMEGFVRANRLEPGCGIS